jgi:glycolate oxidase iron-sulfur subunit
MLTEQTTTERTLTELPVLKNALQAETDKILGCIHCGLCLPTCPTYQVLGNENDSPRGRIYQMRAVAEGRLAVESAKFARHIDLCLGCRACETACPAGVNYSHLLEAARSEILKHEEGKRTTAPKRLLKLALKKIFPDPRATARVMRLNRLLRDSGLVQLALRVAPLRKLMLGVWPQSEFALSLLLASRPAFKPLKRRKAKKRAHEDGTSAASIAVEDKPLAEPRNVTVFTGCVMEGLFKHTNDATARVLAANGCHFTPVPTQVCCGALHAHSGDLETARELARRNIDAFEGMAEEGMILPTVIINSAGCGSTLKEYGELLKDDPVYAARAHRFSRRVKDVSEYLAAIGPRGGAPLEERVTYDAPCHLYHAQRITTAPMLVLQAAIPGLRFEPLEGMADCCGGAGIYNLSEPEMSERLLSDKIEKVKRTGAEILMTANPGCHMQLGAGARLFKADCRVAHVVELLDESYRRAGYYET